MTASGAIGSPKRTLADPRESVVWLDVAVAVSVFVTVVEICVACPLMVVGYAVITVVGLGASIPHSPDPLSNSAGYKTFGRPTPIGTLSLPLWSTVMLVQVRISVSYKVGTR